MRRLRNPATATVTVIRQCAPGYAGLGMVASVVMFVPLVVESPLWSSVPCDVRAGAGLLRCD
ncbi:hypothetical protein [Amycolatopsis thermophila]|uniref:Uncharacterized protein n=1 Tax=Amycolatopsis thermophila TaxID=206084 RepID=A0ABU0F7S4_9PSEU|nr:hypothetical protein [Amycolatopsis thermophila]MDQ0383095.1 hypothetical protein [Amycolatopsis thermophila]